MNPYLKATTNLIKWLNTLPLEEVEAIATGTLKPSLHTKTTRTPKASPVDTSQLLTDTYHHIDTATTRDNVVTLLGHKQYTKPLLVQIAAHYQTHINKSKDTKAILIDKIAEGTVGAKLRYSSLLGQ